VSDSIYENKNYKVIVGVPPATEQLPNPIDCYLVVNKETNVIEYWESVLFYAKQRADLFDRMLSGKYKIDDWGQPVEVVEVEVEEEVEEEAPKATTKKSKANLN